MRPFIASFSNSILDNLKKDPTRPARKNDPPARPPPPAVGAPAPAAPPETSSAAPPAQAPTAAAPNPYAGKSRRKSFSS